VGFSIFGQNDTALHELIDYRSFRPFGNHPAIPEVIVRSPGDLLKSDGLFFSFRKNAFRPPLSAVPVGLLQNRRVLQPAERIAGKGDKVRRPGNLFHRIQKLRTVAVNRIRRHVSERDYPLADDLLQHLHGQLRFRLERTPIGKPALLPALSVIFAEPLLRNKQPVIHKTVPVARGIGRIDAHLAVLHFSHIAAVLPGNADGIIPFLHKTRFIENQHAFGIPQIFGDHAVVSGKDPLLFPGNIAQEVLHGSHFGALHVQGDRLNGLSLQLAHLACHILIKVLPRLFPGKAIGKLGVKSFELFHKKSNIFFVDQQFRNGKATIFNSVFRYHGRPPVLVLINK